MVEVEVNVNGSKCNKCKINGKGERCKDIIGRIWQK